MNMLHTPYANVVRNGKRIKIPTEELVIDDIVVFSAGNQICADAEVIYGEVRVNEALLTGESDEIVKSVGNRLMSGSVVASGVCYARLNFVGEDSYISKLTTEAKRIDHKEQSEMIASINKLVLFVEIAIIPIGIALFVQSYLYQKVEFSESIVSMVAAIIGMIPEGLYLLATIAMAVSAVRLAQNQVLLHDMKSIETLARVNVLCVDKTRTITKNEMEVCELINLNERDLVSEHKLEELISDFVSVMDSDNITIQAMKEHFVTGNNRCCKCKYGFSSIYKYSAAEFSDGNYVLGAPEFVLREQYEEQKRKIVHCLQKLGNTVAMTGDGVNDVLALKDSDCSVAMASGSEAASQVAQVVLPDNDFSKMPSVVLEGIRVVNNIQRSAGLFFVKNIFSFILSILSLVFMFSYPLEPSQISFISMFTISIHGFFLALEPDKSRIEGRFLPNVMKKAIPGGMVDVFGVGALVFCGKAFHLNNADISTAATLLLSVIGFMVLFKVSRPMNTLRMVVLIGNMIALVLTGVFFNHLFALEAMSLECILLFIMFSFAAESFLRYLEKFVDWCYSVIKMRNYKKANNI